jgi:gliding motility-associated-like protein
MKKIMLLTSMFLCSIAGYSQLDLEGFEGATFPPADWSIYNIAGPGVTWVHGDVATGQFAYEGDHSAYLNRETMPAGQFTEDFLVTKPFNVPTTPQLRFYSRLSFNNENGNTYKVMLLPPTGDPADPTDYLLVEDWQESEINPSQQSWNLLTVNSILNSYVGQQVRLAFVMLSPNNGDRWYVDNIEVVTQCLDPANLTANNITQSSAILSWDNPSGATSWEIEIVENAAAPTGTGTTINTMPYTVTGLTSDTCYKYYVKSECTATNESEWEGPYTFCTVAPGATCNAPLVITTLPYTNTNDTQNFGNDYSGSPGASCGTNFNYLSGDDVVYAYTPSQNQIVSINLGNLSDTYAGMFVYTSCADIGVNCYAGAYNENSTDDLDIEQLSLTAGTTYYILISTWPSPDNVEYTINIQVENCAKPLNLTATGATTSSINLAWQEAATATSWEYVMQPVGTGVPAGTGTTIGTTSTTISSLPASTAYEVYVRSDCGNGTFSSWTGPVVFNTLCDSFNLPFSEGFNTASPTEFCWTVVDSNSDDETWDMDYEFDSFEGDEVAVLYTDGHGGDNDDWLISPTINLTGNQRLKYHFRVQSEFEPNDFEVLLSTTGIDAADFTIELVALDEHDNENYIEVIVNLVDGTNTPISGPVNIAWHVPPGGPDGWRLFVDNVIIEDIPSCPDPTDLAASGIDDNSAILTWEAGFNETAWEIVVQPEGTGEPTAAGTPVTTTPSYNAGPLDPETYYEYYVRAVCAADDMSNWVGPFVFMTTQVPGTLTYTDGFEVAPTEWAILNGSEPNVWTVGTAVSNSGTSSLYITNDGGVSNSYTADGAFSVVHAFRDLQIPTPVSQISVSFDWRTQAEPCCDYLKVWLVPAGFVPTPGTEIEEDGTNMLLSNNLNYSNTWVTENYVVDASAFQGQIMRLIFEWRNDFSVGGEFPAAVDNVIVKVITCPSPSNLEASNITLTEATVSWIAPTTGTPTYDYYVSTENDAPEAATAPTGNVSAETVDLENLEESTIYYVWVRSNCGAADGNSFWVGPLEFHTLCGPFTVPFFEGFNSNSSSEFCWTVTDSNGDDETWNMNYDFNQYEGDQVAAMYTDFNNGDNDDWLISPTIILTGNQRLKYRYRVNSEFEPNDFEVLLSTTGTNPSAFTEVLVPLASYDNEEYIELIVNLEDASNTLISGPVNIAWHVPAGGLDGWTLFIDNVVVEDIPPCPEPLNVQVSCLSSEGANFSWEQGGTETSWEFAIVDGGDPMPTTGTVIDEMIYYAMDLDPETAYTFHVRAICPDEEGVGAWVSVNFTTPTTSVVDANAFCSSDNPDQSIVFANEWGGQVEPYGPVACLFSTPNPVWYYLQVDNPGDLYFQLVQNTNFDDNGNPTGTGLDVDFVAYGPFTSLNEACDQIELEQCDGCPNNTADPNYYPVGNIVDCSYDAAFVENFTIPNAQTGQIYAVLITNFNGSQGEIKLQQLDTSTGTTDCNILYQVALGEDQIFCGETETTITAEVTTPGDSQSPTYEWFIGGVPIETPNIVATTELSQTIQVTESGVYSVEITVPNSANTDPIVDQVTITFGPEVNAVAPQQYVVCDDVSNDGVAEFNLNSLNAQAIGTMNAADFTVTYYASAADAANNTNAISNPSAYNNTTAGAQTLYASVRSIAVPTCFAVVPVELVVSPLPITNMPVNYTACEGEQVVITGTPDNYNVADAAYAWFLNGAPINDITTNTLTVTEGGVYTLQVTLNDCPHSVETTVNITPLPVFTLGGPYVVCDPQSAVITVDPENFDTANATFVWAMADGTPVAGTGASITADTYGTYNVTVTVNNCTANGSVTVTENPDGVDFAFVDGCEDNIYSIDAAPVNESFDPETAAFTWTGPDGFVPPAAGTVGAMTIVPTVPGTYTVTFITPEGCIGADEFPVTSTTCNIQRGISPGDSADNNTFDLTTLDVTHLSIFNRYGQEVFSYSNYTNQWGGQDKHGNELPSGTYFYSFERANGETKTGWIYINRQN